MGAELLEVAQERRVFVRDLLDIQPEQALGFFQGFLEMGERHIIVADDVILFYDKQIPHEIPQFPLFFFSQ